MIANLCRRERNQSNNRITFKMQFVLWFAGLRGAIAFALALNMPGPNAETYTTVTLTICGITTIICGGFTEKMLGLCGMKKVDDDDPISSNSTKTDYDNNEDDDEEQSDLFLSSTIMQSENIRYAYVGMKGLWFNVDQYYLRKMFGGPIGPMISSPGKNRADELGHYELGTISDNDDDGESDDKDDGLWQK